MFIQEGECKFGNDEISIPPHSCANLLGICALLICSVVQNHKIISGTMKRGNGPIPLFPKKGNFGIRKKFCPSGRAIWNNPKKCFLPLDLEKEETGQFPFSGKGDFGTSEKKMPFW
jgi:hypothetical protein